MTVLLLDATEDGPGEETHISFGGAHICTVSGVFDGASVELQMMSPRDPNDRWVFNRTYTKEENNAMFQMPIGYQARGEIKNANTLTKIFMEVVS